MSKVSQIQLIVALHFLLLNKQEIFNGYGQIIHKYRGIIQNVIQNFYLLVDQFLQLDYIVAYSTNNTNFLNLKRLISSKVPT